MRNMTATTLGPAETPDIPVREGEYGDEVFAVEPGGIEMIPEGERHGRPLDLFWTWMSPNLEFATVYVGVLPIAVFGGGFWLTALGVVLGTALGATTHGILSSWGPRFGIPQMVQARGAFGFLGTILPAGLNAFTAGVGWFVVNSVSGAFALSALTHMSFNLAFIIVVCAQVVVAFVGHNFVHAFERWVFPYLAVVFAIATVVTLTKAHFGTGFNPKAPVAAGGSSAAFILAVVISFGYAIGWNPYASDYTRYLPSSVNRFKVGLAAALGILVSCAVLEIAGAASATLAGTNANPTTNFTDPLGTFLGDLVLIGVTIGAVSANVLNIYSGAMSFLTLGIKLKLRIRRALTALGCGVIGLVVGLHFQANVGPGSKYDNFLLAISYWITPFLAVVLVDYFVFRRGGNYDEHEFFDTRRRLWQAPLSMALGIAASIPFWAQQPPFLGSFAKAHPGAGDLSFIVGFGVAGVVYLLLGAVTRRATAPAAAT
jgi:nucleobase:cation symporter-1, NCS1 family